MNWGKYELMRSKKNVSWCQWNNHKIDKLASNCKITVLFRTFIYNNSKPVRLNKGKLSINCKDKRF